MAKNGTQGMVKLLGYKGHAFDGSQGNSWVTNLKAGFPASPIHNECTAKGDEIYDSNDESYPVTDEGITTFYEDVLDGFLRLSADAGDSGTAFFSVNTDFPNFDMVYAGNIPGAGPSLDTPDLAGLTTPYRVPNPSNADVSTPHDPETKGSPPPGFTTGQEHVSFGSGEGSVLTIHASSQTIGKKKFTELDFQYNSTT